MVEVLSEADYLLCETPGVPDNARRSKVRYSGIQAVLYSPELRRSLRVSGADGFDAVLRYSGGTAAAFVYYPPELRGSIAVL